MTDQQIPDQNGRTALITGANSGLGLFTAQALAKAGGQVVLACRNPARAATALERVSAVATGPAPEIITLDLADLDSIATAAREFSTRFATLDVLVNNAGIMAPPKSRTVQGFETQFGVNHLGHYALTGQLLDRLLAAPAARVVTVSSGGHRAGWMHWDDLGADRHYSAWLRYAQSKLANLLFSGELARRAQDHQTGLISLAAHPGYAATGLMGNGPGERGENRIMGFFGGVSDRLFAQSAEQGAIPQIHAATAIDVAPDDYFGPDGFLEQRGTSATRVGRTTRARDRVAARRLWELSAEMTGVDYPWPTLDP